MLLVRYRIEENAIRQFGDPRSFVLLDETDTVVRIGPSVEVLADLAFDVFRALEVSHGGYVIRETR